MRRTRNDGVVGDADGVPARVSSGGAERTDLRQRLLHESRLFAELARGCVLERLVLVDETARKRPAAFERRVLATNHEDGPIRSSCPPTALAADEHDVDGHSRAWIVVSERHRASWYVGLMRRASRTNPSPLPARAALLLLLAGCVDKAKADYDHCVERQKAYDVAGAYSACAAAVAADPKTVSGIAAEKDLENLKPVYDKLQAERAERSDRDKAIKRDEPPHVVSAPSASSSAVADANAQQSVALEAQLLYATGDLAGARALLDPRVLEAPKGAPDEITLLRSICKAQKDKACLTALGRKYH